jgi:hypothetical protein
VTPVPQPTRTPLSDEFGRPSRPWVAFFDWLYRQLIALRDEVARIPAGTAGDRIWSAVTAGATQSFLCNGYRGYVVTLANDTTIDPPDTPTEGKSVLLIFVQDPTGGYVVTWDAAWNIPSGINIASAANAVTAVLVEFGPSGVAYVVSDRDTTTSGGIEPWAVQTSTATNITIDHAVSDKHYITVTSNCALDAPINLRPNVPLTVVLRMDATGWVVTPASAWKLPTVGGDILSLPDTETTIVSNVLPAGGLVHISFVSGVDA